MREESRFKKTEVGLLPEEWGTATLSELSTLMTNGFVGTSTVHYAEQGVPYLMANNVRENRLDDTNLTYITQEFHEANSRSCLKAGDILTVQTGFIGVSCLVPKKYEDANTHALIITRIDPKKADSRFVCQFINSGTGKNNVQRIQTAGGRPHLNTGDFINFVVPLPSLAEQEKIADILSDYDSCAELIENLIAAKSKSKRGLMQQLLSGKKRFQEFAGEEWKSVHLGDVFRERCETYADTLRKLQQQAKAGKSHTQKVSLELLSITGKDGVVRRDTLSKRDTSSEDKSNYLRIYPGDIGYNTMRMWQGVSGLSDMEGIVSPAYTICTPTKEIDGRFASYLFKHLPVIHLFWRYSQGLVDDTLNLKFPHFAQIKVLLPPIKEQRRIAKVLETCDKEIRLLEKQLDALKRQKRGLMQKLLTGQIRVKVGDERKEEMVNA